LVYYQAPHGFGIEIARAMLERGEAVVAAESTDYGQRATALRSGAPVAGGQFEYSLAQRTRTVRQ